MLWAKMLLISDIIFVAEPLEYYRKHGNSLTANSSTNKLLLAEYCQIVHYISFNVQVPKPILEKF